MAIARGSLKTSIPRVNAIQCCSLPYCRANQSHTALAGVVVGMDRIVLAAVVTSCRGRAGHRSRFAKGHAHRAARPIYDSRDTRAQRHRRVHRVVRAAPQARQRPHPTVPVPRREDAVVIMFPEIYAMQQVRAIFEAACDAQARCRCAPT